MSLVYYAFIKDKAAVTNSAFESYTASLGLRLTVHPEHDYLKDTGFAPVCLEDSRFTQNGVGRFITGFESYPSLYSPKQGATKELPFDPKKIEGRTFVLFLSCGMSDAFEPLIAYLFGAFCIKCCGGVFYDPQDDICWDDLSEIERTIASDIEELIPAVKQGQLPTHEFEGWI